MRDASPRHSDYSCDKVGFASDDPDETTHADR